MKITRVGGRISRDRLPPRGQPVHGWLAPPGATCPGGKINWDTGNKITGGLQLVCGQPTLALSSALVPQTLSCSVCVEDS